MQLDDESDALDAKAGKHSVSGKGRRKGQRVFAVKREKGG